MYESYFNLTERPFAAVPRIDHYFPAANIENARTMLARCIERAEGTAIVVGASGTGKTLLCQLLAEQFKTSFQVASLPSGHLCTRRALLQALLYELGQTYRGMDEGELRLALVDHMTLNEDCGRGIVLLVDEAHDLPLRLLDEIRMLTNLMRAGQPAVRLVLSGNRGLEERFANPKLESFSQRVAMRCYLEAFQRAETQDYIHARVTSAGGRAAQIFPAETCQSVYKATDGIPRLINQVCDHVMLLAYAAQRRAIEPPHIEEAWADLQQLPTPWAEPQKQVSDSVIEFGGLDDETPTAAESSEMVLRISPEIGLAPTTDPDPADQIHQIQEILSDVEEEFRPAGSIRPEIELVFDEPENPFRERFVEEEVITDRYAPPPVAAKTPETIEPARPVESARPMEPAMPIDPPRRIERLAAGLQSLAASAAAAQPAMAVPAAATRRDEPSAETFPMHRETLEREQEPDDADMIVIEEGYEDMPSWPARNVVAVRRQEYGRLFAKLRQGT